MDNLHGEHTILFVDDEEVVLEVGTMMLKKLGYKALQAKNGKEACQVFMDNKDAICLVILDMKLPDENGTDTCIKIKEINPDVIVIHTSGLGRGQGNEVLDCSCDGFLPKPFRIEELSNRLKELLENTRE
jgi:DNA-binding response OmpR family regulator